MPTSRREFIQDALKSITLIGVVPIALCEIKKKEQLKMLTEQGDLVEINPDNIKHPVDKRKATLLEIHHWIKPQE